MTTTTLPGAPPPRRVRVAILGGGAAAMSAAYWLTCSAPLRQRFQVDVYAPGWRLGGKCASGRDAADHQRIEEHGLHVLMGCYENAFKTLRQCYAEWAVPPGHPFSDGHGRADWTRAFATHNRITVRPPGLSGPWSFDALPNAARPGASQPLSPAERCPMEPESPSTIAHLLALLRQWLGVRAQDVPRQWFGGIEVEALLERIDLALGSSLEQPAFEQLLEDMFTLTRSIEAQVVRMRPELAPAPTDSNCDGECKGVLAALGFGIMRGLLRDVNLGGDAAIDRLDRLDFRAWLRTCGLGEESVSSPFIRALYDLAFAFRGGDSSRLDNGSMAAGATLRFVLEAVLAYKGAPLWKMDGGMGDVVFTPFYRVLEARGVGIHLFHRVTEIVADAQLQVGTVRLAVQARTVDGAAYDPFVRVKGLECWPNQPHWAQLAPHASVDRATVDFESARDASQVDTVELRKGTGFDVVVVAFPPNVIEQVARGFAGHDWDQMLENSASVATAAFQLWMKPDLPALGWPLGSTVLSAYEREFDSWADMSHLLAREAWEGHPQPPGSVHYFCGTVPDDAAGAKALAHAWLARHIGVLWPGVRPPPPDPANVASGYYRINREGSERYVQTPAGSVRHRLRSDGALFGNLYVAGDWTRTRFSGGCVESAFESGILAAKGICSRPNP